MKASVTDFAWAALGHLFVIALLVIGCSVPDDPGLQNVEAGIRSMPLSDQQIARRWTANERAWRYFVAQDQSTPLMSVTCSDRDGNTRTDTYSVEHMTECLGAYMAELVERTPRGALVFADCVNTMISATSVRLSATASRADMVCTHRFMPLFQQDVTDPAWDPDNIDERVIAEDLIESSTPPAWVWGTLFVVVGGIVVVTSGGTGGLLPALCLLSNDEAHWSCPASPRYPPRKTPQPQQPGGDR